MRWLRAIVFLIGIASHAQSPAGQLPCHKALQKFLGSDLKPESRIKTLNSAQADVRKMDQYMSETASLRAEIAKEEGELYLALKGEFGGGKIPIDAFANADKLMALKERLKSASTKYVGHIPSGRMLELREYVKSVPGASDKGQYMTSELQDRTVDFYFSSQDSTLHFNHVIGVGGFATANTFAINTTTCEATPAWKTLCRVLRKTRVPSSILEKEDFANLQTFVNDCKSGNGFINLAKGKSQSRTVSDKDLETLSANDFRYLACHCEKTGLKEPFRSCDGRMTSDGLTLVQLVKKINKDQKIAESQLRESELRSTESFCAEFAADSKQKGQPDKDSDAGTQ